MAAAGKATAVQGRAPANYNFVAMDQIWKDHIGHEVAATRMWPNNWKFMTTSYNDLVKDQFPELGNAKLRRQKMQQEVMSVIQVRPATPIENYITVLPSPRPFPKTTAREIGWRSKDRDLALEKYGKYARPKGSLVKDLKWPQEAVN